MTTSKYETIKNLVAATKPGWIADEEEALRVASYQLYADMYWNVKTAFKLIERGSENAPLYLPKPKTIVETLHRYMANSLKIVLDKSFESESENPEGAQFFVDLMRRERFYSKFSNEKRFGIMRGDWIFHIVANDELVEGSRISIFTIDPSQLFKITMPGNVDAVIGYDIATFFEENNNSFVRRFTYMKESQSPGASKISVEEHIFKADNWGGPGMDREEATPIKTTIPLKTLPDEIDSLPIYHIKNFEQSGDPWGSSELRGLECILTGVNQTATDEQLTLALEGLGVYVTDAGQPLDKNNQIVAWNLGPGRVVEIAPGSVFNRVNGVSTISPMLDHLKMMNNSLDEATGQPDIAKGNVEVQAAESGVALAIRFGPLVSLATEKELTITDVMTNMLFDLRKWEAAYERTNILENIRFIPTYGDKIPPNKQQQVDNIIALATTTPTPIIDTSTARGMLRDLGYAIPDDTEVTDNVLFEKQSSAQIEADAMGTRLDNEIANAATTSEGDVTLDQTIA